MTNFEKRDIHVSLIIPAYNEEHRLAATIMNYGQVLYTHFGNQFEMIIVANGCTDRTVDQAHSMIAHFPQVRVIEIGQPIGKGGAILEGFRQAQGTQVVFADADGATSPDSLIDLIRCLDQQDVAIGSRRLPDSVIPNKQPLLRQFFGTLFVLIVRLLFSMPFRDTQCGAKAFRLNAARQLAHTVQETHWLFDIDLLLSAQRLGMRIAEYPVTWCDQPGSHVRFLSTTQELFHGFWRIKRRHGQLVAGADVTNQERRTANSASLNILALNWRCLEHPQAGGSEINLFEQAQRWVRDGHQVTVVCARSGNKGEAETQQQINGVQVQRMGNRFTVYLHAALFLMRYGHRFDRILDVANGVPFFAPLFSRTPAALLIHHVHNTQWFTEFPALVARVGWFIEQRAVPLIYRNRPVITVSPTTRDALIELGFAPAQLSIVYNGITSSGTVQSKDEQTSLRIAYVGRLKRYKQLERLVQAVAMLRQQFPTIHLDIAGDGDARPSIEALVETLDLQNHVTIYGFVDEDKKAEILASATVFATPSMHEGWGISIIEANAYGVPAVAYNVPGLNVAIRHQETGLLANDDASFQQSLALLLADSALHAQYSDAARAWSSLFDWDSSSILSLEILRAAARRTIENRKAGRNFALRSAEHVEILSRLQIVENHTQQVAA